MRPNTLAPLFIYILIFFFSGCDNKDIVSPAMDQDIISEPSSGLEPEWLSLPENEENSLNESFTVSKLIEADKKEFLTLNGRYKGGELGSVSIACVIVFPVGSFNEDMNITMTLDEKNGHVTFEPEMELNIPAKFSMILKGIDLTKEDLNNAAFINFDKYDGIIEIVHKRLKVQEESGMIGVYEAEINKFSKYGFTTI